MGGCEPLEGGFELALRFARSVGLLGMGGSPSRRLSGEELDPHAVEEREATPASRLVARDREEPRREVHVGIEARRVPRKTEPSLLQKVFCDPRVAHHAREKAVQARRELVNHVSEHTRVAGA